MAALPTIRLPAQVSLRSIQPTKVSVAHSLKSQARTTGSQQWALRFGYSALKRAEHAVLYPFLLAKRGQADTFTVTLPGSATPQGTWAGSPVVNGASQSGRVVNLRGLTASQATAAKAGDILTIAGQTKVYMVTADAASDGAGLAAVTIEPALQAAPIDGAVITSSNVVFTVALVSDNIDTTLTPGIYYSLEIDMIERF